MTEETELTRFAVRLNKACDLFGVAELGKGRQIQLGQMIGATKEAARKWVNGVAMPSRRMTRKLADALGIDLAWLEYGLESDTHDSKAVKKPIPIDAQIEGAYYLVIGSLLLEGMAVAPARTGEGAREHFYVHNKGRLMPVFVSTVEEMPNGSYRAAVDGDLEEGTVTVIVVPVRGYQNDVQYMLNYSDTIEHSTPKGAHRELQLEKRKNNWYLGNGILLEKKISVNSFFA